MIFVGLLLSYLTFPVLVAMLGRISLLLFRNRNSLRLGAKLITDVQEKFTFYYHYSFSIIVAYEESTTQPHSL